MVDTTDSPMIVQALLNRGSAPEWKAHGFYKNQAAKNGWKVTVQRQEKSFAA